MIAEGTNEKTDSRSTQEGYENIYQPGREGITRAKSQATGSINQRIYRTSSSQSCGFTGGTPKIGGNIDQLIRTIQGQIAVNQAAIEGIYEMQSQLKACLDELIEIRDTSKNID